MLHLTLHLSRLAAALVAAALVAARPADAQTSSPLTRPADESIVRALLATNPSTPLELVRAARILVDLGHPARARPLITQLASKKLNDEVLAQLVEEIGSAVLLRLARVPELRPMAGQFCTVALEGAQRYARDPARLEGLVTRLKGASNYDHATIVAAFRPGGDAAVAALVAALADPARGDEHALIRAALVELGSVASAPLVAVLESTDTRLVSQALDVLDSLNDPSLADYLLAPALSADSPPRVRDAGRRAVLAYFGHLPTPEAAAARLQGRVRAALRSSPRPDSQAAQPALPIRWRWDEERKRLLAERVSPQAAELLAALDLATDARRILPDSDTIRRLYLSTLAQVVARVGAEKEAAGDVSKAQDVLNQTSIADLEDLLSSAVQDDQPRAAVVAAQLLGERGDANILYAHSPQPSGLVRAVDHPDRGLRFVALEAIMRLAPRAPFPGASRVSEALEFFARSSGLPRALVAAATPAEAGRIAGLLAEQGYEPDVASTAAGALRLAATAADYEVILVDTTLASPTAGQLLQRLRSDSRTAMIPLGLVSMADEFTAAEKLARRIPLCVAVMRTHNAAATQFELARLFNSTGRTTIARDARREQGAKALRWIAALAQDRRQIYDSRRIETAIIGSLSMPDLNEAAIAALAKLDTPQPTSARRSGQPAVGPAGRSPGGCAGLCR